MPTRRTKSSAAGRTAANARRKPAAAAKVQPKKAAIASAAKTRSAKPAKPAKADKAVKAKKIKLVRDSFTMPENEYELLAQLKKRCLAAGVAAKKSEIFRVAVISLAAASDAVVVKAVQRLEVIKTGRPAKASK